MSTNSDKLQTVIGKTVTVRGEVVGVESLTIEGRLEGKIVLENSIYVRETGVVNADISSHSITVAGSVSGNIVATDKVEILRGGIMVGDIKAPRVVINDGANLKGHVEMDVSEDRVQARLKAAAETVRVDVAPQPQSPVPVSTPPTPASSPAPAAVATPEAEESRRRSFSGLLARK